MCSLPVVVSYASQQECSTNYYIKQPESFDHLYNYNSLRPEAVLKPCCNKAIGVSINTTGRIV